jgi:hypothetical protein
MTKRICEGQEGGLGTERCDVQGHIIGSRLSSGLQGCSAKQQTR